MPTAQVNFYVTDPNTVCTDTSDMAYFTVLRSEIFKSMYLIIVGVFTKLPPTEYV